VGWNDIRLYRWWHALLMRSTRTYPRSWRGLLGLPLLLVQPALAQQPCAIDLGPDHTICQGESVTLTAPPGFPNYLWSTGSTAQSITVANSGAYWGQVSYPTGELAVNGNFSAGNTGFTSEYTYSPQLTNEGNYFIGNNAVIYHPQFIGTGNGPFMMVNAGWMHAGWEVWCQTHAVCPGQTYQLRFRAVSLVAQGPPTLQWYVNGQPTFLNHQTLGPNNWQYFTTLWTAPAGVTQATFCIEVTTGNGVGNDFGLDDISISSTIVLTDQVNVNVTPLPVVDLGPNTSLCEGTTLTLDAAVPGGTYAWQDGSTSPTFTVTGPGTYSVAVTANGCTNGDAITVAYLPLPVVDLGPDQTLCAGSTVMLNATIPGATYLWQNGSTAPTQSVSGPGTYSVTVTLNGCSTSDAVNIAYEPLPVVDLGDDQSICPGGTAVFNAATAGASYLWHDGSTGPSLSTNSAGPVSVTVTVNGCSSSDAATVTVLTAPVVNLGNDTTLCPGEQLLLTAAVPGASYLWNDGSTAPDRLVVAAGTYAVTVTDGNGCSSSDDIMVFYADPANLDLGPDTTICAGSQLLLNATQPGATYAWSTGATTATLPVTSAGTYSVVVSQAGCTSSDAITVSVDPSPVVQLGNDTTLCPGEQLLLQVDPEAGSTVLWNTGSTAASLLVQQAGSFSATVTNSLGCSASSSITVSYAQPAAVDLGADQVLCAGTSLVLGSALPAGSYQWSTGATSPTLTVTSAGTYWVTVIQGSCAESDSITIQVEDPGSIDLGADQHHCMGSSTVLDASLPGASLLWNDGSTDAVRTITSSGTYSVTATVNGCSVFDSITITFHPMPVVELGPEQSFCPGSPPTFSVATAGASYLWHNGSTAPSIVVDATELVWVTVSIGDCSASDTVQVTQVPGPSVDLGTEAVLCEGTSLELDVTQAEASYLWDNGSTSPTRTIHGPGTYWVEVERNDCVVRDSLLVTLFSAALVDLGSDAQLCPGASLVLENPVAGGTVLWSDGSVSPQLIVAAEGLYWLEVTVGDCVARDTVLVALTAVPPLELGPDQLLCEGDSLELVVEPGGAQVLWSTGGTSPLLVVSETGTYSVALTVAGCTVADSVGITVIDHIDSLDLDAEMTLCTGSALVLDAGLPIPATYSWNNGATTPAITVSVPGPYRVHATGNCVDALAEVLVVAVECGTLVHVPNAFTPDNDGINDVFRVVVEGAVSNYRLDIFDRWGAPVFSTEDPHAHWDGTLAGSVVRDGVYVWRLAYRHVVNGGVVNERRMGHVTLLR
jgi:gliding motility-associated-like protein